MPRPAAEDKPVTRILGIDISLRSTGYAVIEHGGGRMRALASGAIRSAASASHSTILLNLQRKIADLIGSSAPDEAAIEGIFFCKNVKTAVTLGEARGAVLTACAATELPVYEYLPRKVKQAVTGNGAAEKHQVRMMVMSLLGLDAEPQEDAGDAMAIAICHHHRRSAYEILKPTRL